jgi:hypothetical protein
MLKRVSIGIGNQTNKVLHDHFRDDRVLVKDVADSPLPPLVVDAAWRGSISASD